MPEVVIADTTCFIILSKINELDLLQKVYGTIITTPDIALEFGEILPEWILIRSAIDPQKQNILKQQVDNGEASAIALAIETPGSLVILDDLQARVLAEKLGVLVTGTIGVIIRAKLRGIIPSIKPLLNQIRETDFLISDTGVEMALKQAQE